MTSLEKLVRVNEETTAKEEKTEDMPDNGINSLFLAMKQRRLPAMSAQSGTSNGVEIPQNNTPQGTEGAPSKPSLAGLLAKRRSTNFKGLVKSQMAIRRITRARLTDLPVVKPMENTYRMKPKDGHVFSPCKIRDVVAQILQDYLQGFKYDPTRAGDVVSDLSDLIKSRVKQMNVPRYKVVAQVTLGQTKDQGLEFVSRGIWDASTDNCCTVTHREGSLFVLVIVHWVFFE